VHLWASTHLPYCSVQEGIILTKGSGWLCLSSSTVVKRDLGDVDKDFSSIIMLNLGYEKQLWSYKLMCENGERYSSGFPLIFGDGTRLYF
jgi:hypothetical protein